MTEMIKILSFKAGSLHRAAPADRTTMTCNLQGWKAQLAFLLLEIVVIQDISPLLSIPPYDLFFSLYWYFTDRLFWLWPLPIHTHTHTQLHPLPMILSLVHMQLCMDHWCLHARNHNKNQVTGFWAAGSAEPWPFVLPLLYLHSYLAVGLLFVGQLGVRRRFRSRPPRSCHSPFLQSGHETTEASVGEGHKAWIEGWINQAHKSQYVFLPDFLNHSNN